MATKKKLLQAAAGTAASGGGGLNVENVFSTYLYEGTETARDITNNIDLSTEGGMVWAKQRDATRFHFLVDTERGSSKTIYSNDNGAEGTRTNHFTAFNTDGFSLGTDTDINQSSKDYASWTWRKAPRFFDCVTYTGDGTAGRTVSHNLGSVPGCIIVKCTSNGTDWGVYHRGLNGGVDPEDYRIYLNLTSAEADNNTFWNDTAPTSTEFTVGTSGLTNQSGRTYVAYLFAHNDGDGEFGPTGDQDIIKCGSYTGANPATIDLGFEPQWIMIKRSSGTGDWVMFDAMRGLVVEGNDAYLYANTSGAEVSNTRLNITPTGFVTDTTDYRISSNGETYIYIAIRRGPMAVPESATEVFDVQTYTEILTSGTTITSGFVTDTVLQTRNSAALGSYVTPRLTNGYMPTHDTSTEAANDLFWDRQDGVGVNTLFNNSSTETDVVHMWKRAPNFFDVVCYDGDATASPNSRDIEHNLGVAPEMMWIKCRSFAENWAVYHSGIGATKYLNLNGTAAAATSGNWWRDTAPTDTVFTIGHQDDVNANGETHIAYLFASLDGVSKVGSYTGNGSSQTIDCGFSSGARFVLIKRTDDTGSWYLFDSERGIVAGNDPFLYLNSTASENSSLDTIDPDSSGFIVNQMSGTNINVSSATYIFYAIA